MEEMARETVWVFFTVTVLIALVSLTTTLPKLSDAADNVTVPVPVPLRLTVCGLPLALSLTERVALCAPVLCGLKVTEIEQVPPAANELPQVLVWENWVPGSVMPDMVTAVV
jgi:hypothetical protein